MNDPTFRSPFNTSAPKVTACQRREREQERRSRKAAELAATHEEIRRLRAEAERREKVIREYDRT